MKIKIENKNVVVISENVKEGQELLALALVKKTRAHKKHVYIKNCPVCGYACKGNCGLGIHMRRKHNMSRNGELVIQDTKEEE